MTRIKLMKLPRSVLVGEDVLKKTFEVISDLRLEGPLTVVSDKNTYPIAGRKLESLLKQDLHVESHIIDDATVEEVQRLEEVLQKQMSSFAIAAGGGRVIDVTKLASKNTGIDFISVPTAAAHDGITSSRASIKVDGKTSSIGAEPPIAIIADTNIIGRAPRRLLASGCGDIISKYTSVRDWELARDEVGEEYSEYASALSLMSAKIIMDSSDNVGDGSEESVRRVVKALISCGVAMSIAGSSRPASGSEHKFSHAIDRLIDSPALHGEQCGVGSIMMMYLHGGDWQKIKDALKKIGAPTTAKELGLDDDLIVKALVEARNIRPERYTILEKVKLTRIEAYDLARSTGVI